MLSRSERIEGKEIRRILKGVSCSNISKLLRKDGEYELMMEEKDHFIMMNMFYYKQSAVNTSIKLSGYSDNSIIYRVDNIVIKNNYDEIIRFLQDIGEIDLEIYKQIREEQRNSNNNVA